MRLPDELLRQIFQHIDSDDIGQKFYLAQVCYQWRKTALGQCSLWNRIAIMRPLDGKRLFTVLDRSGSAPLDVRLLFQYSSARVETAATASKWRKRVQNLFADKLHMEHNSAVFQHGHQEQVLNVSARVGIATTLARCHKRLRSLFIDISHMGKQAPVLTPLLGVGLSFPILEDLEIRNSEYYDKECDLSFSAPRLNSLKLRRQGAVAWEPLIVPSLTHLFLKKCFQADLHLLEIILHRCPELRSLTFHKDFHHVTDSVADFYALKTSARLLVPHLKFSDLSGFEPGDISGNWPNW